MQFKGANISMISNLNKKISSYVVRALCMAILLTLIFVFAFLFVGCRASEKKLPGESLSYQDSLNLPVQDTAVAPLSLKEAFTLLQESAKEKDLVFRAYTGIDMRTDGKTIGYSLTGYSRSARREYYLSGNVAKVRTDSVVVSNPDEISGFEIDKVKDSSQLSEELIAANGPCEKLRIEIQPGSDKAVGKCFGDWTGEVSMLK